MTSLQTITAPAKEWIAALNRLTPATTGKKATFILGMVHIDPAKASLFAVGRDVSAQTELSDADGEGSPFLVSYAWLKDAITSTTGRNRNGQVKVTADGKQATVAALGYKLSVETAPVADFPEKGEHQIFATRSTLDATELREALARAVVAASKDDTLPILAAVHFAPTPHGLRLWATDRYRLVSDVIVGPGIGEESFTAPASALKLIAKQLKAGSVSVGLNAKGGPIIFKTTDSVYEVTPVEGKYPDLAGLFGIKPETVIDVDRVQLLAAATVANRMSERFTPALLSIAATGVQITFNGGLFGPDVTPLAAGTLDGDPVEIALNARFLMDALSSFKGDKVRIHGFSPLKQFSFIDGGADLADDAIYRHLIMTVRMPRG